MKTIDILVKVSTEGIITPLKFRFIDDNEEWRTIKVDSVLNREKKRIIGNEYIIIFNCKSIIEGKIHDYKLVFNIATSKWCLKK